MASNPILRALQVLSPLGSPSEGPIETNYGKRWNWNVRDFPLFETSKHPKEDLEERGMVDVEDYFRWVRHPPIEKKSGADICLNQRNRKTRVGGCQNSYT